MQARPRHLLHRRAALLLVLLPIAVAAYPHAGWHAPTGLLVAVSPDGNFLASVDQIAPRRRGNAATRLEVRRLDTGQRVIHDRSQAQIRSLAFSADSSLLATGLRTGMVRIWDLHAAKLRSSFPVDSFAIDFVLGDTKLVAAGTGAIRLFDVATGQPGAALDAEQMNYVGAAVAGNRMAVNTFSSQTGTWETEIYEIRSDGFREISGLGNTQGPRGRIGSLSWDSSGRRLLVTDKRGAQLWSTDEARLINSWNPGAYMRGPQFGGGTLAPDDSGVAALVVASPDTIDVWDTSLPAAKRQRLAGAGLIEQITYSPDGRKLISIGRDAVTRVWDVGNWRQLTSYSADRAIVLTLWGLLAVFVCWSGIWIATGRSAKSLYLAAADVLFLKLLVCAAVVVRVTSYGDPHDDARIPYVLLFAILGSAAGLPGLWMTLLGVRWSLRLPIALLGLTVIWMVPMFFMQDMVALHLASIGAVAGVILFLLAASLLRRRGLRIVQRQGDAQEIQSVPAMDQMPLRDLIRSVVAVGIVFGVMRLQMPQLQPPLVYLLVLTIVGILVVLLVAGILAGLSKRPLLWFGLLLGVAWLVGPAKWPFWFWSMSDSVLWWLAMALPTAAFLAALVFRLHGFRVQTQVRGGQKDCPHHSATEPSSWKTRGISRVP